MEVFYKCNPEKNYLCAKTNCFINGGPCSKTKNKEFTDAPDHVQLVMPMTQEDVNAVFGRNRKERRKNGFTGK